MGLASDQTAGFPDFNPFQSPDEQKTEWVAQPTHMCEPMKKTDRTAAQANLVKKNTPNSSKIYIYIYITEYYSTVIAFFINI